MTFVVGAKDPSEGSIWSTYSESVDTLKIYVSSSTGDDDNDGLTDATPKATITGTNGAKSLRVGRTGKPDWLLLKRGDTWDETALKGMWFNGRSADEPTIITAYGDEALARPVWKCNTSNGGIFDNGNANEKMDYLAILHIDFYCSKQDPNSSDYDPSWITVRGINSNNKLNWRLIEGCRFRFVSVIQQHSATPFSATGTYYFRNSTFVDCASTGGTTTAVFLFDVLAPIFHNVTFDRQGRYSVVGAFGTKTIYAPSSGQSHSLYTQLNCGPGEYYNLFQSRGIDMQMRTAGPIRNVLVNDCTDSLMACEGICSDTSTLVLTGVRTGMDCADVVVLKGFSHPGSLGAVDRRTRGVYAWMADGGTINDCIFAHSNADPENSAGFTIGFYLEDRTAGLECRDVTCSRNIAYNYTSGGVDFKMDTVSATTCSFDGTNLDDENGDNVEHSFLAPDDADLGIYLQDVLGMVGATDDDFYDLIREQRKGDWNDALAMYCVVPWMKHKFARGTWLTASV
jgi:hypothetical protein